MRTPSQSRGFGANQKANRVYLFVILFFSLGLFSMNVASIVRQEQVIQELSASNYRHVGENIVRDLERQLNERAMLCLSEDNIRPLQLEKYTKNSVEQALLLRQRLSNLKARYPIVDHFFVVRAGVPIYPRLTAPGETARGFPLPPLTSPIEREFAGLLAAGSRKEKDRSLRHEAAIDYVSAAELNVPGRLKALALSRAGAFLLNRGAVPEAAEIFNRIVSEFADEYDESGIPHVIRLATGSDELLKRILPSRESFLRGTYEKLLNSRWEISAEEAEDLAAQLEVKLGLKYGERQPTSLIGNFTLAHALETLSSRVPLTSISGVYSQAVAHNGHSYLCFLSPTTGSGKTESVFVGFSVDIEWVEKNLLVDLLRRRGGQEAMTASLIPIRSSGSPQEDEEAILTPFANVAWQLRIPFSTLEIVQAIATRELAFLGASLVMVISVLSIGVYLLIRASRDMYLDRLRSNFVSGITHELKTPLSLIRLYSEILEDDEFTANERQRYIQIILRESENLSRMVDNALTFARLEEGTRKHYTEEGDLADVASTVVEKFIPYLRQQGFTVKTGIQKEVPPVRFNRQEVTRAMMNLIDNAVKYSGASRLIRVHLWVQYQWVVFEVQDYGIGIPSQHQQRIFESFYRIETSDEKGGFGLGLYLVKQVMDSHEGKIELISEEDRGARFRLLFRISAQEGRQQPDYSLGRITNPHLPSYPD